MAYDIIEKIQQMVAKAESTDSMAEAETIMTMVRKMLDQHGISLLTITKHQRRDLDPVGTSRDVYGWWAADNWMRKLSAAAGDYYGVKVVWTKRGNKTDIAIVGRESCRAAYLAMLPYLRMQVNRLAKRGWHRYDYRSESVGRNQIGIALSYRLYALAAEKREETETLSGKQGAGLNALIPVDEIEVEMREAFPALKEYALWRRAARPSKAAIAAAAEVSLADQLAKKGAPKYVVGSK